MRNEEIDRQRRYGAPCDFFTLGGSIIMKLTADAAIAVCQQAAGRGLVVCRVEGGFWYFPGFQARLDCIWDGIDPPVDVGQAQENNIAAANFISSERASYDVFIITAPSMAGW